jgi:hypothetical protein
MLRLVDVINNNKYHNQLKDYVAYTIMNEPHMNQANYKFLLDSDLSSFYHRFTMLLQNDKIVSIQGVRHSSRKFDYPKNVARIADRHYVDPAFRAKHLGVRTSFYRLYILHDDIEYLRTNHPIVNTVFFSIQGSRGPANISNRLKKLYPNFNTDHKFYQTCSNKTKRCWQSCMYSNIYNEPNTLELPSIEYEDWMTLED